MEEIRFTCQEVADILGCTKQTIYNWIDNGKLPSREETNRVNGKSIRYLTEADLLLYLNQEHQKLEACLRNLITARKAKRDLGN
jgi:excisionase family DNA binding protein